MSLLLASAVVVTFAVMITRLKLTDRAREAGRRARECIDVLRDPSLDDDMKERTLRRQSLRLFRLSAILTGGGVLSLFVPLLGVWLLDRAGFATFDGVLSVLQRVDFLAATIAAGLLVSLLIRWLRRP